MTDRVINNATTLLNMRDALLSDTRSSGKTVVVMRPVNLQANSAASGWIGLYVDDVNYVPRAAGAGLRNWNYTPVYRIIVQHSDMQDAGLAFSKLEDLVKVVLDVVMDNRTLGGQVDTLMSVHVQYDFLEKDAKTMHFAAALVTLTFEGRSN